MTSLIVWFDFIGITAFAATGAMVAGQKRMDAFGGLVLAVVTGVGGGTLRDMILDTPVFWLRESHALLACLTGFGLSWLALLFRRKPYLPVHFTKTMQWLDALGLALFTVIGARKALILGDSAGVAIVMGILTGIGGGMLRDVLANKVPLVLSRIRFYATASLCGAVVFVLLWTTGSAVAFGAGFAVTLLLRMGALLYDWRLPMFPAYQESDPADNL
jgi:uncharacterized membrane protein YeiH